jgi:DNA integrity scanning protein DisA with diadenylate cyclase activity
LEQLVGVESNGSSIVLNFQDCKEGGIQAGKPYILHYTGQTMSKRIAKTAVINANYTALQFADQKTGTIVTMSGVKEQKEGKGLYGILVRDNAEAAFTSADVATNGFYATRCFIELSSGNDTQLITRHLAAGEISGIADIVASNQIVDVYNISGMKVASGISASQVSKLQPGVYVINGQKVLVR